MQPAIEEIVVQLERAGADPSELKAIKNQARSVEVLHAHDMLTSSEKWRINDRIRRQAKAKLHAKTTANDPLEG